MHHSPKIVFESLESRQLFAGITLSHHVLNVIGSSAANTITVGLSPDQQSVVASISFQPRKGGPQEFVQTFPVSGVRGVYIQGGPAADLITIDQTNGSFTIPAKIVAGGGNDTVYGGDEDDDINGGTGNDYIDAGGGLNRVLGEGGNDTLIGGDGSNILVGGTGNDSLVGGAGNDTLFGQAGSDTLMGNGGNDMLRGGAGRDSEVGGDGNDTLFDASGHDTMLGGAGTNVFIVVSLHGDPDNDFVASQDAIKRIAPPTSNGFWDNFLQGYLFPFY